MRAPRRFVGIHISVCQPGQPAAGVEAGAQIEQLLRPLRIPAVLVLPRPLHADRAAERLRQQQRVGRRMVGAVGAVRARPLHEDHPHRLGRQAEDAGEGCAKAVGHLRGRPDGGAVGADVGDGARGAERGVALTGPEIGGRQRLRGAGHRLVHVCRGRRRSDPDRPRRRADTARAGRGPAARAARSTSTSAPTPPVPPPTRGSRPPRESCRSGRRERREYCEIDDSSTDVEPRADGRRTDHARVEHAGNAEVLDVGVASGALGGHVRPER